MSVGQWFTLMQQDGPGAETTTEHADREAQIEWRNKIRAKKGLPLLPTARDRAESEGKMKNEEVEAGMDVQTPHGAGKVLDRDEQNDGWIVQRADGAKAFYHAWDFSRQPKPKEPAKK